MIERIEFVVEGKQDFLSYDREKYLSHLHEKKQTYIHAHRIIKQCIVDGEMMEFENKEGIPSFNWDGLLFFAEKEERIVICNLDRSIRYSVIIPEVMIQWESFVEHFELDPRGYEKKEYIIGFSGFNGYFEYQGKHYVQVKIELRRKNELFDAFTQMRYLDSETGAFLPFTKEISRMTPNQYAYNEETILL